MASFGSAAKGTGLKALEFALSICDSVDMYGFTVDPGYKEWTRYFSDSRQGHTPLHEDEGNQSASAVNPNEGEDMQDEGPVNEEQTDVNVNVILLMFYYSSPSGEINLLIYIAPSNQAQCFAAKLWSCNFNSHLANALIIQGDYQASLSSLEQAYMSATELHYPKLQVSISFFNPLPYSLSFISCLLLYSAPQMFFATSILHVHLMQWDDVSLVEQAVNQSHVHFVSVSATIPNIEDIGKVEFCDIGFQSRESKAPSKLYIRQQREAKRQFLLSLSKKFTNLQKNWMHLHFLRAIETTLSMRAGIAADTVAALLFRVLPHPGFFSPHQDKLKLNFSNFDVRYFGIPSSGKTILLLALAGNLDSSLKLSEFDLCLLLSLLVPGLADNGSDQSPDLAANEHRMRNSELDSLMVSRNSKVERIVLAAAAKHLTSVVLELGGKCPVIVDSDINLKVVVSRIISGNWGCNNGQACIAPDYIITTKDFAPKLVDSQTDIKNLKIAPTILLDVPEDSLIMSDEIFGPLLPIVTVNHLEDSFNIINTRPKPLEDSFNIMF
ncbi:hypothetical protein POM88_003291 [Heracleum sosnowskyi]|uniref:Aldehyde dehydrogenase domain-containing protein n=1 Tax=Heracleum sosnowskyi TaxID=360622 RepID=A0AAD8JHA3_9APIA|nr:hypothetical protein POM88_003291 [Heracleum sosnowskyi]